MTGRQEWAGEDGWWNEKDREAQMEAEVMRFDARAAETVQAGARRQLLSIGRQVIVFPKGGTSYKLYGTDPDDPRIEALIRKVDAQGVRTSSDGTSLAALSPFTVSNGPNAPFSHP